MLLSRTPSLQQRGFCSKSPSGGGNGNRNIDKDKPDLGTSGKSDKPITRAGTTTSTAPGSDTAASSAASTGVSRENASAAGGDGKGRGGLPHQVSEFYAGKQAFLWEKGRQG